MRRIIALILTAALMILCSCSKNDKPRPEKEATLTFSTQDEAVESKASDGIGKNEDSVPVFADDSVIIDIPYINQREKYPNGCESVSCVMLLRYLGYEISVDEFIEKYLEKTKAPTVGEIGEDPDIYYLGDPFSDFGWGCNSPVIVSALRKYLNDEADIIHNYGKELSELCSEYIDRGEAVMVWVTVDMINSATDGYLRYWYTPKGKQICYNSRLHCMVLCGYDEDFYYFNDPLTHARKAYPRYDSEIAYELMGKQSIVIKGNDSNGR